MDRKEISQAMSTEEKMRLLSGQGMSTVPQEAYGIPELTFADGPHGVRAEPEKNCTHFPSLCLVGCTWSRETAYRMGAALADECIRHGVDMLLGPGINIKRHILCGRNFEYFSEDPLLSGELAAAYIRGLQEKGVSACVKHYAANNQEENRLDISVEADERTLREIYLKGFEIAVKKSAPDAVMCAYNKVNGIWCSENPHLLREILKEEWGYKGIVVSDWGAVQNISLSVHAGLDLEMPGCADAPERLQKGLAEGLVFKEEIDAAAARVLRFHEREVVPAIRYDREAQHEIAREIAADGIVLLKNEKRLLPISRDKYKKIAIVGEFAVKPLIGGQGAAEVYPSESYTDTPLSELQKRLPGTECVYIEGYKRAFSEQMLWPTLGKFRKEIGDCQLVLFFAGSMISEDTENFDRRSAYMNQNYEMFIKEAVKEGKPTVVVLQNGGALLFGQGLQLSDAVVESYLGGEAAGSAIADVLCGIVNPCGRLAETFPTELRRDLPYPGNGRFVEYRERLDVGYRYYDRHPEEILFPFGHGLSYTAFSYTDLQIDGDRSVSFTLRNVGECAGAEVVQLYVGDPVSTVVRPLKELKHFDKIFLQPGEEKQITFTLTEEDLSYYNPDLHAWVAEDGRYDVYVGASSQDIRLTGSFVHIGKMPYTLRRTGSGMIGGMDDF